MIISLQLSALLHQIHISNQIFFITKDSHNQAKHFICPQGPIKRLREQHMEQKHGTLNVVHRDPSLFKVPKSKEWTICLPALTILTQRREEAVSHVLVRC